MLHQGDVFTFEARFFRISANEQHPDAASDMTVFNFPTFLDSISFQPYIYDSLVGLRLSTVNTLVVWNWKLGTLIFVRPLFFLTQRVPDFNRA